MIQTTAAGWGKIDPRQLFQAASAENVCSSLHITRLAPGDRSLTLDWVDFDPAQASGKSYAIEYRVRNEPEPIRLAVDAPSGSLTITGLDNGVDYEVVAIGSDAGSPANNIVSPIRLFRPGVVPGTVINYVHPEDYTYNFSGRSPASPSIVRLPSGELLASHDLFWGLGGQNTSIIFRSRDEGQTWSYVTFLYPCFWGKLFMHQDRLYMLATSTEYGALLIGASDDGGETWSEPVVLIEGGSREAGGPHKAPMPVIEHQGRLWTGIDYGSWTTGSHASGLISVPVDADLLDRTNWSIMPFLPFNPDWPGTVGGQKHGLLEGNAVVTPDGSLVNLLRYQTRGGTPDHGRAIMLKADADRPGEPLTFGKVISFYGNLTKFTVYYDPASKKYWSLVNRVAGPNIGMRNVLTLVCSEDVEHWHIVQDILDYEHNGWPEDSTKVGFQYVDWQFHGDDILFVSRTAINGAYNFHNANYITYHRIDSFRTLS